MQLFQVEGSGSDPLSPGTKRARGDPARHDADKPVRLWLPDIKPERLPSVSAVGTHPRNPPHQP